MSRRRASAATPGDPTGFTQTLLARLGLPPDADHDDIAEAHDGIVAFLESAPSELRPWAQQQLTAAEAAFTLLAGPGLEMPPRPRQARAVDPDEDDDAEPAAHQDDDAEPAAAEAVPDLTKRDESPADEVEDDAHDDLDADADDPDADDPDEDAEDEDEHDEPEEHEEPDEHEETLHTGPAQRRQNNAATGGRRGKAARRRAQRRRARQGGSGRPAPAPGRQRRIPGSRLFQALLALAVVAGVVYGVYQSGDHGSLPGLSAKATDSASAQPVDQAKVAALMQKLDANPKDVDTLRTLGDMYFQSADYKAAATWQQKIVDINPQDVTARLALGAANFNAGNNAEAEKQWLQVVAIDPKQAEAHYDLGFLYLSANPPDMTKVKSEWTKVVEIDPNSDIAKNVSTHLESLANQSASPSPVTGK
jgi:cytochrome c-type biogenesis protein CcmH/NrfG